MPVPQLCTHAPAPIASDYGRRYFGLFLRPVPLSARRRFRADERHDRRRLSRARFRNLVDMGYESREEADKARGRRFSAAAGSRGR